MLKSLALVSILATAAAATAQSPSDSPATQQAPAPIVRSYQSTPAPQSEPEPQQGNQPYPGTGRVPMPRRSRRSENSSDQILDSQPISGVWLRSRSTAVLKTISATPRGTEIRLERGILNVNVHQPAVHSEILIDLPGGQTSLLKDGLYTFNADTNTVRVLHGEAAAYPGPISGAARASVSGANIQSEKPIKIKEAHQLSFVPALNNPGERLKSVEVYPYELTADLLPIENGDGRYANYSGDDGPYYGGGWGYPAGFYPGYYPGYYGFGYPYSYGIGIGYYGGLGRGFGGYRGGYRGGFRR